MEQTQPARRLRSAYIVKPWYDWTFFLLPPELAHEPDVALFGGADGYEVLRPFAAGVFEHMASGASVLVEIDPGQVDTIAEWFAEAGLVEVETLRDLAGRPRGVVARRL